VKNKETVVAVLKRQITNKEGKPDLLTKDHMIAVWKTKVGRHVAEIITGKDLQSE